MIKENRMIRLYDGTEIYTQIKEVAAPVWIIVTHGLGEHLERHNYILNLFHNNFNIFQYDLRGHGRSEGKKAYIDHFDQYYQDLDAVINYVIKTFKAERIVLFGHSMGALITAGYVQSYLKDHFYPSSIFLSAPPVNTPGVLGKALHMCQNITEQLIKIPFSIPLSKMIDLHRLSHDGQVYENYIRDELNALRVHSKLLLNLISASSKVFSRPIRAQCPLACAFGSEDIIIDVPSLETYFNQLEKSAKLIRIEHGYHELHNEIMKYRHVYFKELTHFISQTFYTDDGDFIH